MTSMKTKFRRKQGRKNSSLPFVQLFKYMLRCPAWTSLSATAKAAYVQIALRYDGVNNGAIAVSVRPLARELNVSKSGSGASADRVGGRRLHRDGQARHVRPPEPQGQRVPADNVPVRRDRRIADQEVHVLGHAGRHRRGADTKAMAG
jgi:hypothetical protein